LFLKGSDARDQDYRRPETALHCQLRLDFYEQLLDLFHGHSTTALPPITLLAALDLTGIGIPAS
jgi:hypothetical protein